jgi:hypothetical protein
MNITPDEAQDALTAIQKVTEKARRSLSSSGGYAFFIIWGAVWLIGFLGNQFLPNALAGYIWLAIDILGGLASWIVGMRMNRKVRSAKSTVTGKRLAWFWILLILYLTAIISVAWPVNVKQIAMFIILIVMIGWLAMGLLLSFTSVRLALAVTSLALVGYFLLPDTFYLWMAILGGGGLITLGIYIRLRW